MIIITSMINPHSISGLHVRTLTISILILHSNITVLDPRFNYKKLKKDYTGDPDLLSYLETQKAALQVYFDEFYPPLSSDTTTSQIVSTTNEGSKQPGIINFAEFDLGSDDEAEGDELTRYFDAPRASSETDPIQWWFTRKTESPRLWRMARDFMAVPGVSLAILCFCFIMSNRS